MVHDARRYGRLLFTFGCMLLFGYCRLMCVLLFVAWCFMVGVCVRGAFALCRVWCAL